MEIIDTSETDLESSRIRTWKKWLSHCPTSSSLWKESGPPEERPLAPKHCRIRTEALPTQDQRVPCTLHPLPLLHPTARLTDSGSRDTGQVRNQLAEALGQSRHQQMESPPSVLSPAQVRDGSSPHLVAPTFRRAADALGHLNDTKAASLGLETRGRAGRPVGTELSTQGLQQLTSMCHHLPGPLHEAFTHIDSLKLPNYLRGPPSYR